MTRRLIATATLIAATAGAIAAVDVARATDRPLADDWPVNRTYASAQLIMYVDPYAQRLTDPSFAFASIGGCTPLALDDSCA